MESRRKFIVGAAAGAVALLSCVRLSHAAEDEDSSEEVSANEDLMREHGVLRRALLVYSLTAPRLRANPGKVVAPALNRTATLFRRFGEDYHERALEEPFIFPRVKRAGGEAAAIVDVLLEQHRRGREITGFIIAETRNASSLNPAKGVAMAHALDSFVLMYQEHTAREDTVVFPAWHSSMSKHEYDEAGERFEAIERKQFGHDGFEDAVKQIAAIEKELDIYDLSRFTAPPPPTAS